MAFFLKAFITQRRGTHPRGVAGVGTATVLNNPELPDHELFTPGRQFQIRIRHANLARPDDAFVDIRALSLKFADSDFDSPLDLFFHTGEEAVFWNIASFHETLTALAGKNGEFKALVLKYPWRYVKYIYLSIYLSIYLHLLHNSSLFYYFLSVWLSVCIFFYFCG